MLRITGGSASDTLVASTGLQTMLGKAGDDTFVFEFGQKTVGIVRDFHAGQDQLEIHGVNPATTDFSRPAHYVAPGLTTVDIGQDHIQLLGVSHVSASDFLFHV